ncbi:O-acetylserine/cysteine efflux transporter [Noviherbaspirillum humi]|uniref:O-acetylserine/cysteine efflux transporter n=1 Tax=Noviherbaspirillum humi TaxID=1688639 RepID=A0A239L759_9BURK|nr:EamA family transporter [Noviherbaspirillum humi]SNT25364.1 O-acetylserine/cysteine efflux transporter [Noviherbaspirillum humi]
MRAPSPAPFGLRDYGAAIGIVLIWGLNFVAMKLALRDFTPMQLGAARYVFAFLPLALLVRPPRMPPKWLALYGLCQGVGQFGLLFLALQVGMTAALASVLVQTQVFFTALLGFLFLREHVGRPLQLGLVLAAVGLGCFAANYLAPGAGATQATTPLGFLLSLGAAAMWAVSNIVVRKAQRATPEFNVLGFMVWTSMVPVLPFMLLSWVFDAPQARWRWLHAAPSSWAAVAALGWVATILAYTLWTGLLKRHAASRVAPFSLGVPLVGLAAGTLLLGETVSGWQWAGIVLLAGALGIVLLGPRWQGSFKTRIGSAERELEQGKETL